MQRTIKINTSTHNVLCHSNRQVEGIVAERKVKTGMVNIYAQAATAVIMILFI